MPGGHPLWCPVGEAGGPCGAPDGIMGSLEKNAWIGWIHHGCRTPNDDGEACIEIVPLADCSVTNSNGVSLGESEL